MQILFVDDIDAVSLRVQQRGFPFTLVQDLLPALLLCGRPQVAAPAAQQRLECPPRARRVAQWRNVAAIVERLPVTGSAGTVWGARPAGSV
jgi:hypothetical protein